MDILSGGGAGGLGGLTALLSLSDGFGAGGLGGFLGGGAESETGYQTGYKGKAPKPMPTTPEWERLFERFITDYTGQTKKDVKKETKAKDHYTKASQDLRKYEGKLAKAKLNNNSSNISKYTKKIAEQQTIVDQRKALYEDLSATPVKEAYTEGLADVRGAYGDLAGYQTEKAGLIPEALTGANVKYQGLLDQIINQGLTGEGLGFTPEQMDAMITAASGPQGESMGLSFGGETLANIFPKGAYEGQAAAAGAIPGILGERRETMGLLNQLAEQGMLANVLPAQAEYQYGQTPYETLLSRSREAPAGSDILAALSSNPALQHETLRYLGGAGIPTGSGYGEGSASGASQGGLAELLRGLGALAEGLGGGQGAAALGAA